MRDDRRHPRERMGTLILCGDCAGLETRPRFTQITLAGTCESCGSTSSWIPATSYRLALLVHRRLRLADRLRVANEIAFANAYAVEHRLKQGGLGARRAARERVAAHRTLRERLISKAVN